MVHLRLRSSLATGLIMVGLVVWANELTAGDLDAIKMGADIHAGGEDRDETTWSSGEAGGCIVLESGADVATGNGSKGALVSEEDVTWLDSGEHDFSQVSVKNLKCKGPVLIRCQASVRLRTVHAEGDNARYSHFVIHAAGPIELYEVWGETGNPHSTSGSYGRTSRFQRVELKTRQLGSIQGNDLYAGGGRAHAGKPQDFEERGRPCPGWSGGRGGTIKVHARGGGVRLRSASTDGGGGGCGKYTLVKKLIEGRDEDLDGTPGGAGGDGGEIALVGEAVSVDTLSAGGGDGGDGGGASMAFGRRGLAKRAHGTPGAGGAGGAGGKVLITGDTHSKDYGSSAPGGKGGEGGRVLASNGDLVYGQQGANGLIGTVFVTGRR